MSVSVRVVAGFNAADEVYQVSASVVGAEWGSAAYEAHQGYDESDSLESAYGYVLAEAGLVGLAPTFAELVAKAPRGFVHRLDLVVEVA